MGPSFTVDRLRAFSLDIVGCGWNATGYIIIPDHLFPSTIPGEIDAHRMHVDLKLLVDNRMPISQSDPRVFFAAERTLLAWFRTGLTIIALGFVIARFGLFLQVLSLQAPNAIPIHSRMSAILGITFVVSGAFAILAATVQHRRFIATLAHIDLPASYSTTFAVGFGIFMGALGIVLAAYLAISHM
jgi:putative membrane protein